MAFLAPMWLFNYHIVTNFCSPLNGEQNAQGRREIDTKERLRQENKRTERGWRPRFKAAAPCRRTARRAGIGVGKPERKTEALAGLRTDSSRVTPRDAELVAGVVALAHDGNLVYGRVLRELSAREARGVRGGAVDRVLPRAAARIRRGDPPLDRGAVRSGEAP